MRKRTSDDDAALTLFVEGDADRALFVLDDAGLVMTWNAGAQLMTGWQASEIVGKSAALIYPESERDAGQLRLDMQVAEKRGRLRNDAWRMRKDGTEFLADFRITVMPGAFGSLPRFGVAMNDITDRKASERALERSALHLRSILAAVPDAMIVIDERGMILSFSAAAIALFGYAETEVLGRNIGMLIPQSDRMILDGNAVSGQKLLACAGRIVRGLRRDGSEFPIELQIGEADTDGNRIFTAFIRDLTDRQRAELKLEELQSDLIHVARLSAMGTMASTLAHELNQPLTAITNYLEAARALLDRDHLSPDLETMLRDSVEESAKEALRAGGIVRRLREFVSRGDVEKHVEDLPRMIDEASRLALIGARERGISADFIINTRVGLVLVDRIQIQQVLVNLIRNAVEAMADSPVRELVIAARPAANNMVRVSVSDTGSGIDPLVGSKLFQAFATGKENGMGLGLSICRTIIEAHGGRIWAEPRLGGGTIFQFTIMAAKAEDLE
ncbi:PAS domain-containing sensor histidine kinase [Nostoc sp. 3335mG]|nr:PAS domain-containing sensor histidine kinase [Nostoc sp. 3335mG]